ncbi:MAG: DUF3619 family protein [Methylophilaceae bacterium]|nr:DUF3619 family protein [Methylophilaceae bacterium]
MMKKHQNIKEDVRNSAMIRNLSSDAQLEQDQDTAKNIVSLLNHHAQNLNAKEISSLKLARQIAVDAHLGHAKAPAFNIAGLVGGLFDYVDHHRAAMSSGLAFGAFLIAILVLQPFNHNNTKNSDAFLLGSELPPEAYADKGFNTWLEKGF